MSERPIGTVTFLFTDIQGSTELLQMLGGSFVDLLSAHHKILRAALGAEGGYEFGTQGDALFYTFASANSALRAAIEAQRRIAEHEWPKGSQVRVRMGLHTGEPICTADNYTGIDVHRAARISSAAHGGQILLSDSTYNLLLDLPNNVSFKDLGVHRLKGLHSGLRLLQVIAPDLRHDFPPLRSLELSANNLPRQLSSFVGRKHDIGRVCEVLRHASLVTLTGVGGSGKSRLAIEIGRNTLGEYPDGVWLVELASLSDPNLIVPAVGSEMAIREKPGQNWIDTLTEGLASKHLLLILDNCEHLLEASAAFAQMVLKRCPDVRILATSRQSLGVSGEWVYSVPPLSLPEVDASVTVEQVSRSEAGELFIERASRARPSFKATGENARPIAELCRHLDGIPLAIELAAARTKVLSPVQILERLNDRFRLLTDGSRTALPKHQTLLASMDWSYRLLPEAQKALLRKLSAFSGGCNISAAEAICSSGAVPQSAVLDGLSQLVDKSLVNVSDEEGHRRFFLHETVRQFAREQLIALSEADQTNEKHASHFASWSREADLGLQGAVQPRWLDALAQEHDNLRAACDWAVEHHRADIALEIVGSLWRYWEIRGNLSEGRNWLERSLSLSTAGFIAARARALDGGGRLAWRQGDYAAAKAYFEESLALWQRLANKSGEANACNGIARAELNMGNVLEAKFWADQSFTLYTQVAVPQGIATVSNTLGEIARAEGKYDSAALRYESSLALFRSCGDLAATVSMLHNLGYVALAQSNTSRAAALFREAIQLARDLKDQMGICHGLAGLGAVAGLKGDAQRGAILFGAAEKARQVGGYVRERVDQLAVDNDIANAISVLGALNFEHAWNVGWNLSIEGALNFALTEPHEPAKSMSAAGP